MNIDAVESLDAPELTPFRTLRRPLEHHRQGIFVAEGEKVVRRLLASGHEVVSLLLTPEWLEEIRNEIVRYAVHRPVPGIYTAPKKLVETIVGYRLHQGIMAVGKLPGNARLEDLLNVKPGLIVATDGLTNAENLGVLVRNCAAFGVNGIIAGETSSSPYLRRAVRNSMGTVFTIPVHHAESLADALRALRERYGYTIYGAHPQPGCAPIYETDFRGDCCLVFGSEGEGLSQQTLDVCSAAVAIPMPERVDSLNVANAAAVFLYEARRQRSGKGNE